MDPRNPKQVIDAIYQLQKLFDEKTVMKANSYNQKMTQEQQVRLNHIRQEIYSSLDTLRDAAD